MTKVLENRWYGFFSLWRKTEKNEWSFLWMVWFQRKHQINCAATWNIYSAVCHIYISLFVIQKSWILFSFTSIIFAKNCSYEPWTNIGIFFWLKKTVCYLLINILNDICTKYQYQEIFSVKNLETSKKNLTTVG